MGQIDHLSYDRVTSGIPTFVASFKYFCTELPICCCVKNRECELFLATFLNYVDANLHKPTKVFPGVYLYVGFRTGIMYSFLQGMEQTYLIRVGSI